MAAPIVTPKTIPIATLWKIAPNTTPKVRPKATHWQTSFPDDDFDSFVITRIVADGWGGVSADDTTRRMIGGSKILASSNKGGVQSSSPSPGDAGTRGNSSISADRNYSLAPDDRARHSVSCQLWPSAAALTA